jgi:hypothetical protein
MAVGDVQKKMPAFACGDAFSLFSFLFFVSLIPSLSTFLSVQQQAKTFPCLSPLNLCCATTFGIYRVQKYVTLNTLSSTTTATLSFIMSQIIHNSPNTFAAGVVVIFPSFVTIHSICYRKRR